MTKEQLLARAAKLGITDVSEENTKAEIADAISKIEPVTNPNAADAASAAEKEQNKGIKYLKYPNGVCVPVKATDAEAHRGRIESEINDFDLIAKGKANMKRIEIVDVEE